MAADVQPNDAGGVLAAAAGQTPRPRYLPTGEQLG
jgi:hypothetical protein